MSDLAAPPTRNENEPTIASAFRRGYDEFAERPAIRELDGTVMSYSEMGNRARRLVGGLRRFGLTKGDRVVVLSKNRSESFVLDHALAIGGFVRVALSYRLHAREVAEIVEDAEAGLVIVDRDRSADVPAALPDAGQRIVCFDEVEGLTCLTELIGDDEGEDIEISPDDLVWMPYTSGTSGRPKGVMHTHRSLLAILRNILVELPEATPDDLLIHVAPTTHLSGYAMMAYFLRGGSNLALEKFEPESYLRTVERFRATVLPLVPTMINMLLPAVARIRPDLSSVTTVLYGGSPIAPERLARAIEAFGPVFIQSYGLTELPYNSWLPMRDHVFDPALPAPERLGSAGRVSPFVDFRLVGPGDEPVEQGEAGEIQVRGDAAMRGYWKLPEQTAETILPGGWIATGDVGRFKDGHLYVVDRKKDMIVSGGFNVYPTEVENVIYTLDAVEEVAVVGIPSEEWGESVHAEIAVREGHTLTAEEVSQVCLDNIAAYKRPRSISFVDALPKTGTGKIVRREIREPYWEGHERRVNG